MARGQYWIHRHCGGDRERAAGPVRRTAVATGAAALNQPTRSPRLSWSQIRGAHLARHRQAAQLQQHDARVVDGVATRRSAQRVVTPRSRRSGACWPSTTASVVVSADRTRWRSACHPAGTVQRSSMRPNRQTRAASNGHREQPDYRKPDEFQIRRTEYRQRTRFDPEPVGQQAGQHDHADHQATTTESTVTVRL